jgi:targeting protein for Xklp2
VPKLSKKEKKATKAAKKAALKVSNGGSASLSSANDTDVVNAIASKAALTGVVQVALPPVAADAVAMDTAATPTLAPTAPAAAAATRSATVDDADGADDAAALDDESSAAAVENSPPTAAPVMVARPPVSAEPPFLVAEGKKKSRVKLLKSWAVSALSPKRSRKKKAAKAAKAATATGAGPTTPPQVKNRLTKPMTPAMMRRSSSKKPKKQVLTHEERELEIIRQKKAEMSKRRRISRNSFKRLSSQGAFEPKKSDKPPTVATDPGLTTAARAPYTLLLPPGSQSGAATDVLPSAPAQRNMVLRSSAPPSSSYTGRRTVQQPFKMSERSPGKRSAGKAAKAPFKAFISQVKKFASTPPRHKRGPKYEKFNPEEFRSEKPKPTVPESPALATASRAQQHALTATSQLSTAEREADELAKLKPFKAQPLNESMMNSAGDYGVPVVKPKAATEIKPFAASEKYQDPYETRRLVREAALEAERAAHPAFQATGLPLEDKSRLPTVEAKPPTRAVPFKLRSDSLRQKNRERLDRQAQAQARERAAASTFKAQPLNENMMNSAGDYGVPVVKPKGLTEIKPFTLNSVRRANERSAYESRKKSQQKVEAELALVKSATEAKAAAKELESFRSAMVHKAKPMPRYTVMQVKPSQKISGVAAAAAETAAPPPPSPSSTLVLKRGPTSIRA